MITDTTLTAIVNTSTPTTYDDNNGKDHSIGAYDDDSAKRNGHDYDYDIDKHEDCNDHAYGHHDYEDGCYANYHDGDAHES